MSTTITQAVVDATVQQQYDGNQATNVGYTDILGSPSANRKLDGGQLATVGHNYGTTVEFAGSKMSVDDAIYLTVQSDHAMKLNTILEQHIHISSMVDPVGKSLKFRLDVAGASPFQDWELLTGDDGLIVEYDFARIHGFDPAIERHWLIELGDIPACNTGVSTIWKIKLTRLAVDASGKTDLGNNLLLEYLDGHVQIDQARGSRDEYIK